MNLKTTVVLLVLVVAGAGFALFASTIAPRVGLAPPIPKEAGKESLRFLGEELKADNIKRIEVEQGDQVMVLQRGEDGEWSLPGQWPTRKAAVEGLVQRLTSLREPRFKPEALGEPPDLKKYGLDAPAVVVRVNAGGKDYKLAFAREIRQGVSPFAQPTYLRIDDNPDVVQLAPDVLSDLQRPPDYYQKRQIFPSERTTKEGMGDSQEKIDRLTAKAVAVKEKKEGGNQYTLEKSGDSWVLRQPIHDRVDPDKLQSILTAVPDLWAEKFVDKPKKDLAEYGLKEPEETIAVTRPNGETVTLLIGKSSQMKTRTITKPGPPNQFGMPSEPTGEVVHEEYRFAKLQDNDQIFEIKANRLKDLVVAATTLRDNKLARFKTDEVRQVEIDQAGKKIVLVKENDKAPWRLKEPMTADAETNKITELLDKLSNLQASGMDVIDKGEAKMYGFDMPAGTIKVKAEEEVKEKDETKTRKTKEFTFVLGKHDKAAGKLYIKVDDFERINAIEDKGKDGLLELVQRPALAYRGRKVFDAPGAELTKMEIQRGDDRLTLEEVKNTWRLTLPVQAEVDTSKVLTLSSDLDRLEAVEYVNDDPQPKDLQEYGLDKPAVTATLTFTKDSKPTTKTLQVGKKRPDKQEFFAKLESGKSVFAISQQIHDALDQNSLAYRPQQLWQIKPEEVASIQVQRTGDEFRLQRKDQAWQITQPFQANASTPQIEELLKTLSSSKADRYEAHVASDLGKYGLDKPALRIAIDVGEKKDDAAPKEKEAPKNRVLLVGKPTEANAKTRFAKLGDGEAVFVIGETLVTAVDHSALDFLDRKLLALDTKGISSIHRTGTGEAWTLLRDKDEWRVESASAKFGADNIAIAGLLRIWNDLQAQKYVAYQPKPEDQAKYGLDKPEQTLTVTLQPAEGEKEAVKHTLTLGKPVEGSAGERYVMVDKGPAVAVLGAVPVTELTRTSLDFADRTLLKLDGSRVTTLLRRMKDTDLELAKKDSAWRIVKPNDQAADEESLDNLVQSLARLRATRVAAFQPKDLKEFGLDMPEAVWTIRLSGEEKPTERVLRIGKPVKEDKAAAEEPERFVQVEGSPAIGVLSGTMARRLLADPIKFRDRSLARFADADQVSFKRGSREAVFAKVGGTWKLTKPLEADAEHDDLNELINALANLKADELVKEMPSADDLKSYGLDHPEGLGFKADGKDVLNLLIGAREKTKAGEGPRVYAMLNGGNLVFLLDPSRSARVLAEYRKRSVWASLDAVQVETLSYGYASNPFVLQKMGETWQVAGKPEAKVKTEAVSETLDALSRLKVERFVVDKGADLKLHGFEPPHLVLEIRTRTGSKNILQVGRQEGDSKRYYARVPDGDRSDVFLLSEADANKIVRPLMAFLDGESKPAKPDKPDKPEKPDKP